MSAAPQKLSRTLTSRDTLTLAFGTMIGWGWVVMCGPWLQAGGSLGATLAFVLVGVAILIVALLYGELAAAMPQVGGEHVYSLKALGRFGSFICTWSICMVYVAVAAFESVALGTVVEYLFPGFQYLKLWQVAGHDIYLSSLVVSVGATLLITWINIRGVKISAVVQFAVTLVIVLVGLMLISGTLFEGRPENWQPLMPHGSAGVITVAAMVIFYFTGFDVIPQAAEEINLPPNRMAKLLIVSVVSGLLWYVLIVLAVSYLLDAEALSSASLAAAVATGMAWGVIGEKLLILGGIAGIITSWNGFVVGGSRALFALAESHMLPDSLTAIHPRHRTPHRCVLLIGVIAMVAPFFGKQVLLWITNAAGFAALMAYLLVAISFVVLRRTHSDMPRPFKLPFGNLFGYLAILVVAVLALAYLPFSPAALAWPFEWLLLLAWFALGLPLYFYATAKSDSGRVLQNTICSSN